MPYFNKQYSFYFKTTKKKKKLTENLSPFKTKSLAFISFQLDEVHRLLSMSSPTLVVDQRLEILDLIFFISL